MKKIIPIATIAALAASAAQGQAILVAGWNFSQYNDNWSTVDNDYIAVDTLWANFSDLAQNDANPAYWGLVGPSNTSFGTLYYNGAHGSTKIVDTSDVYNSPEWSFESNLTANGDMSPLNEGFNGPSTVDGLNLLGQEGNSLRALGFISDVAGDNFVFAAELGSITGSNWTLTYAGRIQNPSTGATADITWAYSTDGVNYTAYGTHTITGTESVFTVDVSGIGELDNQSIVYFRGTASGVSPALGAFPLIDNVGISAVVPEPSTYAAIAGAMVLGLAVRRRRRRVA